MNTQPNFVLSAQMIERAAAGYAGYAAAALLERDASIHARSGADALNKWKAHLTQRLLELAAALIAEEPKLFVSRVLWSARAFRARDQDEQTVQLGLECLREVLAERLPESARVPPTDYIDQALVALEAEVLTADALVLDPEKSTDRLALRYLQKIMEGDVSGAVHEVVSAAGAGLDVRSAYIDVLLPAQREIGRLWHLGEVSVAEEHLVTFTTQRTMAILAHTANSAPSNGKTAIVAAIATNIHDVGLRAVADLYQIAGWRAIFLGADVPMQDLPGMIKYFDADLLLLGATLATQLPRVQDAIAAIRAHSERPVKIIVGGAAFDEAPEVWTKVGADGYASRLDDAVSLGAKLAAG